MAMVGVVLVAAYWWI